MVNNSSHGFHDFSAELPGGPLVEGERDLMETLKTVCGIFQFGLSKSAVEAAVENGG